MGVLDVDVAVGDVAGVGGVGDDPRDGVPGPWFPSAAAHSPPVEFVGDGAGAVAFLGVEAEYFAQVRCLFSVRYEFLCFAVDVIAERTSPAGPFSFAGFGGHAFGDPVDDSFPLEFGEYAEQLDEHAADGGGGVERLGGRGERDVGVIEVVE
ncbi:MAG TPA: hypothetical protein VF003_12900 [Pseudonocardiaceae bacterium]